MQTFATATILLALGAFSAWAGKDEDDRLKEATAPFPKWRELAIKASQPT